jgi:hypothetical protein
MSTKTVKRPAKPAIPPDWRRLCHYYDDGSQVSICGVGRRKPGEDHWEHECRSRGHTICVVCTEILESENRTT